MMSEGESVTGNCIKERYESTKRPPIPSFRLPELSQESLAENEEDEDSGSSMASLPCDLDDSSSEDEEPLSLQERMIRNQERNSQFLQSLHEKYEDHLLLPPSKPITSRKRKATELEEPLTEQQQQAKTRGMLRSKSIIPSSPESLAQNVELLLHNYPHRHSQVRRLMALLHSPSTVLVFITGPRGTGKTSIVREVLHSLEGNTAYINCESLEPMSMERLVADAFKQLRRQRKSKIDEQRTQRELVVRPLETTTKTVLPIPITSNLMDDMKPRLQPQRAAKVTTHTPVLSSSTLKATRDDPVETSSHSTVISFGRSLQKLSTKSVLVLDHAERIPQNGLAELLLLPKVMRLPLQIVVISRYAILKGTRLDAMASPEKSSATLATSLGGLTLSFPAYQDTITTKQVLKAPRLLPLIIGNYKADKPFLNKVIDGFLTSLIQLLSNSTNDINEFVRIGNSLWPFFIQPLHPNTIAETMRSLEAKTVDESVDRDVLGFLGRRFLKEIGNFSHELTRLPLNSQHLDVSPLAVPKQPFRISDLQLPFLRTCLLLACFICQNNRAEHDRKVFSAHGNGKRKKVRKGNDKRDDEVAYAATSGGLDHLKSLRPRSFLIERVFSIFVTLVRLNPDSVPHVPWRTTEELMVDTLGTTRLYDDLRQLIDLGLVHPVAFSGDVKGEQINMNGAKVWCSLTVLEASHLAQTIGIPLDSYLV